MKMTSRSIEQKTNMLGFPKPSEFIEMTGAHALEASDRAIFNTLYQFAHDSGKALDRAAEWEIPLVTLRQGLSQHESNERLRESLERLRSVQANIHYVDENGQPRVIITGLFDFFDIPAREIAKRPALRYGLPRKVIPVLESSGRWGRIKGEIVYAMTSKYAIALYELVQLRAGLERRVETVPINRFRELPSVPPGEYDRFDNLKRKVIEPALLQVNGLSDMGVSIHERRRHATAPADSFDIGWWRKSTGGLQGSIARTQSVEGRSDGAIEGSRDGDRHPAGHLPVAAAERVTANTRQGAPSRRRRRG